MDRVLRAPPVWLTARYAAEWRHVRQTNTNVKVKAPREETHRDVTEHISDRDQVAYIHRDG